MHLEGATLTDAGLYFNGVDQWARIDTWEFGGPVTIEVFCAYDEAAVWEALQPVFDFNTGHGSNTVSLRRNTEGALGIFEIQRQDVGSYKQVTDSNFWELGRWTHVVVTVDGQDLR